MVTVIANEMGGATRTRSRIWWSLAKRSKKASKEGEVRTADGSAAVAPATGELALRAGFMIDVSLLEHERSPVSKKPVIKNGTAFSC